MRRLVIMATAVLLVATGCAHVQRVSVAADGSQSTSDVYEPGAIDDSGDVVAFSTASFLAPDDHEGVSDVYVRDVRHRRTELASIGPNGAQDISSHPGLSGDGRYVAFTTSAGALDQPPPGAVGTHIFVKDRQTGAVDRVVVDGGGHEGFSTGDTATLDGDGSHVLFNWAFPGVDPPNVAYLQDRRTGSTVPVSVGPDGSAASSWAEDLSQTGRYVLFAAAPADILSGNHNHQQQLFVRDMDTGATRWVSVGADRFPLAGNFDGRLSGDGSAVVLWQRDPPYAVYRKDLRTEALQRVDVSDCVAQPAHTYVLASISDDGQAIAFFSDSSTLVARDRNEVSDVFLWRSRRSCSVERISDGRHHQEGDDESYWPEISGNGRAVFFVSQATNLVKGDTNGVADGFLWTDRGLRLFDA